MRKRKYAFTMPMIVIIGICVLINIASWLSTAFSDFYVSRIFPVISGIYGRITSLFPFSVGEIMLMLLVIYLSFGIILLIVCLMMAIIRKYSHKAGDTGLSGEKRFGRALGIVYYNVTPILVTIAVLVMTLNCFVFYHTSKFTVRGSGEKREYTIEELAQLRDFVVKKCNELSEVVPHDANGNVIYDGDMAGTAILAMKALQADYPRMSGYFVTPKPMLFSGFMSQQYMQGYYFPFSMEANYNDIMNLTHKPFTMCHELSHTHAYIYEDEANFFGFLACIRSEDIVFQYSGYLGVLNYINNDFYDSVSKEEYKSHVRISDRVKYDNEFLSKEAWEQVEEKAVLKTETVKKAADAFIDTNLKVNGVPSGKASYSEVVGLIMDYYFEVILAKED
ncbi:MAG: DUF3810 domain-containing protein [Butyrivibrio sp.]|nr:DUF3810 domain-containing protein [Butyrivibrio sp.]